MKKQRLIPAILSALFGYLVSVYSPTCFAGDNEKDASPASLEERLGALEQKLRTLESRVTQLQAGQPAGNEGNTNASGGFEALDQKLRIIERKNEIEKETTATKLKESPVVTAGKDGFGLKSADSNFQLKLGGQVQADSRFFTNNDPQAAAAVSTFALRRIRPILQGTIYKYFDFRIMPDFGNGQTVVQDAYLDFTYLPGAKVRFGKTKPPVGLERLQLDAEFQFVERALPTSLVPNRDVGVEIYGEKLGGIFDYALGVFNGVPDGSLGDLDTNNTKDFAGRGFVNPFRKTTIEPLKGLGLGVAVTTGSQDGVLPSFRTAGQAIFFNYVANTVATGNRHRLTPQAYYYWSRFGLLGEYVQSVQNVRKDKIQGEVNNQAWQVAGSYVLTGEKASYRGVTPVKPFDPTNGSFGALELTARYTQLKVDNDAFILKFADITKSAKQADEWTLGLNWYFSRNLKLVLDYEQTHFKGGSRRGDRETERLVISRFQVAF